MKRRMPTGKFRVKGERQPGGGTSMEVPPGMGLAELSTPLNLPSLIGVYLAVNAISDAAVLVDGPDCTLYKAHFIHGRHDLNSTLLQSSGRHRVLFTNVCSRGVVREHDGIIREHILRLDGLDDAALILVTALPMCSITGVDYGRVIRSLAGKLAKTAIDIPPDSLIGDWLDGYAQTQAALARGLGLRAARRKRGRVAVVGYLMDRNEGDHVANVAELKRMLAGVGLETVSVWFDGGDRAGLIRAEEADVVVSLPYGRVAARRIAERTGAKLVETVLPFGLPRTARFVREVGAAAGRGKEAEAFLDAELSRAIPRLKWIVPHLFLNRSAAFVGDPHLLDGFLDIADDLGLEVQGAIVRGRRAHGGGRPGLPVLHEPPVFSASVRRVLGASVDLLVSSWLGPHMPARSMEFGFPSYRHHALHETPFLGIPGFLAFVERMAENLLPTGRRHA